MIIHMLGFSTGTLYQHFTISETLNCFIKYRFETVEIIAHDNVNEKWWDSFIGKLPNFKYVSLHAPNITYKKDNKTKNLLQEIEALNQLRKLDLVVFHPDKIKELSVFENLNFNIAFENMDNRKKSFKTARELLSVVRDSDYKIVLDLNHLFSNDPTLGIVSDFEKLLKDYIAEVHISGYVGWHDPLYKTKQVNIIEIAKLFDVPIIVESVIKPEELDKEYKFIKNHFKDN